MRAQPCCVITPIIAPQFYKGARVLSSVAIDWNTAAPAPLPTRQAVGAPVIELTTRSRAQPLFIPARRAREPHVSRFSPAPRWGLPFVLLSRSSRPLLCSSALLQAPPLPKETRRVPPNASVAVACSHPSASGWSSLIVPAVRIYSHRVTPHSWPRLHLETPSITARRFAVWRRLLSNRQASWVNSTGPLLCIRPNTAPEASH